jgi:8-amino-7-oxononanoate synthase
LDIFEKTRTFDLTKKAEEAGVYPYFIPISSKTGPEVVIGGKSRIMLGSNNYLGLTQDPRVIEASCQAVQKYGTGCTGSRFMNGTLDLHLELESRLATFAGKESSLVFTTGYQVNLGVISAIAGRHDTVVIDKADHASIVDGCMLSHAKLVRYKHNDMEDLERVLAHCDQSHGILVVVDGVFSMEGDLSNLPEVVRLKKKYGARLLIDEAHSVGVFGAGGRGVAEHFGLIDECDLIMGTFSKSFASTGGYIAGDKEVVYFIRHAARPLIFTAAIPPAAAAAALACLNIIESEPERRARLWANASMMKGWLKEAGFDTGGTESQIVPIVVGEDMRLVYFWKRMYDLGVYTNAAVSPAVEPGHALIRSSYMATHTEEQLTRAFGLMRQAGAELGIVN